MWKSIVIFLLSIVSVNSARVPQPELIGGNPKTWSPKPVQENYTLTIPITLVSELDCTTCKVLIATLETDACLKCSDTKCLDFFEKYGNPVQVCQQLGVCPKSWIENIFG